MFGLELPKLLLVNGSCVSREIGSRASAARAISINVTVIAMEEGIILLIPFISCSFFI